MSYSQVFFEVCVATNPEADNVGTEYFPATIEGWLSAFKYADEALDLHEEVEVYLRRFDDRTGDGVPASDLLRATVGWDDNGKPIDLDADMVDCDDHVIATTPAVMLSRFAKAAERYNA